MSPFRIALSKKVLELTGTLRSVVYILFSTFMTDMQRLQDAAGEPVHAGRPPEQVTHTGSRVMRDQVGTS